MSAAQVFGGNVTTSPTQITVSNGVQTSVYTGSFSYLGNIVTGTLTGYDEYYGGVLLGSARGIIADATSIMAEVYRGNAQGAFSIAFAGIDNFTGSTGNDVIIGYGGPDTFFGGRGNDILEGRDSVDTAIYSGARSEYVLTNVSATQKAVVDKVANRDGTDTLFDMEIVLFNDAVVVYDTGGMAAAGYRMYQAAFARTPDKAGLSYWVDKLMNGVSLRDVAYGFMESPEFKAKYGPNPSSTAFADQLYRNILDRVGDPVEVGYWANLIDSGTNRIDVLAAFADSTENKAKVAPAFAAGVELDLSALF